MKVSKYVYTFNGHISSWRKLERIFYNTRTNSFLAPGKGEHKIVEEILKESPEMIRELSSKIQILVRSLVVL